MICRLCEEQLEAGAYPERSVSANGATAICDACWRDRARGYWRKSAARNGDAKRARDRAWAQRNTENRRKYHLQSKYGLTEEAFAAIKVAQEDRCALCRDPFGKEAFVDHDHACCPGQRSCGECVRGILCRKCNQGLGMFNDNPDLLVAAAMYAVSKRNVIPLVDATS